MITLLDLCVTLSLPPNGSLPEVVASIALNCNELGLSHTGDLLGDPLSIREQNDLRWYLEEYWKWPYNGFAERGKVTEASLVNIGKRLYNSIFTTEAQKIVQPWKLLPGRRRISIISDIPKVLSLPWELLHDEQGFLALRTSNPISVVRRLPQKELPSFPNPFEPPLRVLLITARPIDTNFIDQRVIARELLDSLNEQIEKGEVVLEFLRPPTLPALRERLRKDPPVHVAHFDGHGVFSPGSNVGQGCLAFENEDTKINLVSGSTLAQVLQDSKVQLVVLTACQSAMSAADNAFSSVATQLIKSGINAVIAMSASLLPASASSYAKSFYNELAKDTPAFEANERARQYLHDNQNRFILRRRDGEATNVQLNDWWMPHFYQQRPLIFQRQLNTTKQYTLKKLNSLSETMPQEPRYGFSGYSQELLQIERWLSYKKIVVIHGFGGVGKTSIAREIAVWSTRTNMYRGACFVSFEKGGDSILLLNSIAKYLEMSNGYNPVDRESILQAIASVLQENLLVIIDNIESILKNGSTPLDGQTRDELWETILSLAQMGIGILLTTQVTNFEHRGMLPSSRVAYRQLNGLHSEDAYLLATSILEDLNIDRKRATYKELCDLLDKLGHHPLAIQLVLPALNETPITTIYNDFSKLLPIFKDDTESGRNSSLLASIEYSLRRLSSEQRELLYNLSVFETGATEQSIIEITQMSEQHWEPLKAALEKAALITVEVIHEGIRTHKDKYLPFFHFHPILTPYLRNQQPNFSEEVLERFINSYLKLSKWLYFEDLRHPQQVRTFVRFELPNLRKTLYLLIEKHDVENASTMMDYVGAFLTHFGLWRECNELRIRVSALLGKSLSEDNSTLTRAEYSCEIAKGEYELRKGNLQAAYQCLSSLLERINNLPENHILHPGCYEQSVIHYWLSYYHNLMNDGIEAEVQINKSFEIINKLLDKDNKNKFYLEHRGSLSVTLGTALRHQGKYKEAREKYIEGLNIAEQFNNIPDKLIALMQMGTVDIALELYPQAKIRYTKVFAILKDLGFPPRESIVAYSQLGLIAFHEGQFEEATYYCRESLSISESVNDIANSLKIYSHLGVIASETGHHSEAIKWLEQAHKLARQFNITEEIIPTLHNLAHTLIEQVKLGLLPKQELTKAKSYILQAKNTSEYKDLENDWREFFLLAKLADLEGQTEDAKQYRRQEREAYANFPGYQMRIRYHHGSLIDSVVSAIKGDLSAITKVKSKLQKMQNTDWGNTPFIIHRILNGERDWHKLSEELEASEGHKIKISLIIRLILDGTA